MMTTAVRKSIDFIHDDTEYYPHQIEGIRQLAKMSSFLLADEPGLGKSLQALTVFAIDVVRGQARKLLVVCPATLKGNWQEEIEKHTDFRAHIVNGDKQKRIAQIEAFRASGDHILIVGYEQVVSHYEELNSVGFDLIVYDEAHAIKNHKSKRTKAVQALRAPRHGLLTGTPLMNDVRDLWSLLYRIDPVAFPNYWKFLNRYAVWGGFQSKQVVGVKNEKELKEKLNRYMLRRRKDDVLDLPEKQRIEISVDLTPEQRRLYDEINNEMKITFPHDPTPMDIENAMTKTQKLLQVCGTTSTIDGYGDYSSKLDRMEELAEEFAANGYYMVIFTHFRGVLAAAQMRLETLGAPLFVLHGDVPVDQRQDVVRAWREHSRPAVLLSMGQVGGVGLNMTRARHMIRLDRDFTPAVNEQEEDRIHRIGADTTQPIQIYELICRKTVESRVERILKNKDKIIGAVVNDSEFKKKLIAALAAEEEE